MLYIVVVRIVRCIATISLHKVTLETPPQLLADNTNSTFTKQGYEFCGCPVGAVQCAC
jgi:hypothetical protein